jgi:ABC-type sugar transport system ATPase subunit
MGMSARRLGDASTAPSAQSGVADMPIDRPVVLEVRGLVKDFPGTRALDGVDLEIRRGEIHALLGENGAGKSTLIKAVAGAHWPTAGVILVDGQEVTLASPQAAHALGIAVVHQHSNLVPQLSIAENLALGERLPRRLGLLVDWPTVERRAAELLGRVGLEIDARKPVRELRADELAMVSIAKAIASRAKLIILDEPTSALLPGEVEVLFAQMRRLAAEGNAFLYVSHRLTEVFAIADRVTVLRDGRRVGTWTRAEMSPRMIIEAIVGGHRSLVGDGVEAEPVLGPVALAADQVCGGRVQQLSFEVRAGEILGFAGLPGSGAEHALDLLFARRPITGGTLTLAGRPTAFRSPREAKQAGLALVPKDRLTESLLPGHSVRENISLSSLGAFVTDPVLRFIRRGRERSEAEGVARRLAVKTPSIETSISALSGGNQQKAMLGRWLMTKAQVYLLNAPTAAVDVGAKAEIYGLIRRIAADGAAVIFTSPEVEEFPRVCHRVLVFREGRIVGELKRRDASETRIMNLAVGEKDEP